MHTFDPLKKKKKPGKPTHFAQERAVVAYKNN